MTARTARPLLPALLLAAVWLAGCSLLVDDYHSSAAADGDAGVDSGDGQVDAADPGPDSDGDTDDGGDEAGDQGGDEDPGPGCVLRVDQDNQSPGDGSDWPSAMADLHQAILAAHSLATDSGGICEVWVKAGRYHMFSSARDETLALQSNVHVYGHFAGTETSLEQRDLYLPSSRTVLDGCLRDPCPDADQRVYHVVTVENVQNAVIDGFTIVNGNAYSSDDPTDSIRWGGGMYISQSSIAVRNCIFANNWGCKGGGLYIDGGQPVVKNCVFVRNEGYTDIGSLGGGIYVASLDGALTLVNCTVHGNLTVVGGGLYNCAGGRTLMLLNTIVWGNYTTGSSPDLHTCGSSTTTLVNSDAPGGELVDGSLYGDALFVDAVDADMDDTWDLHLRAGSPCINAGYHSQDVPAHDIEGRPRDDTPDMGAYETLE